MIFELEARLQPLETPVEVPVRSDTETNRATCKRDVSSSYATLMPKKARKERERENNVETKLVQDQLDTEVIPCIFFSLLTIVHPDLERSFYQWKKKLLRTVEAHS